MAWDGSCAWVQIGWQTVKVDRAQMRPAYGFENWTPDGDDVQALRTAEKNFLSGEVSDERGPGPPEDEPLIPEIADYGTQAVVPEAVAPTTDLYRLPEAVAHHQRSEGAPSEGYGPSRRGSVRGDAAPYESRRHSMSSSAPPASIPPQASEAPSSMPTVGTSTKRAGESLPAEEQPAPKTQAVHAEGEAATTPLAPPSTSGAAGPSEMSVLSLTNVGPHTWALEEPGADGSSPLRNRSERLIHLPEVFRSEHEAPELGSDDDLETCHHDWWMCYTADQDKLVNPKTLTRKEQRALDREIPWREIVSRGGEFLEAFYKAAEKEHQSWMDWGPVIALSEKEAKEIMSDPQKRKRIMKSRSCYRDKNVGVPPLKAKARVVALGHTDPDLSLISRDSPTPSRLSEMILLTVYVSGANGRFANTQKRWHLKMADASTAFLQGRQPEKERPDHLYMSPPNDPIALGVKGAWTAPLYRITGNVYGLANAPRLWTQEVIRKLKDAGFSATTLDRMLFEHRNESGDLTCLALVYVDDFLVTFREDFDFTKLETMFQWGGWTSATEGFKFKGKFLRLFEDEGEFVLTISQKEFIQAMEPGKISRTRSQQDTKLTAAEMSEFRSVAGSLQGAVGQTRPDCAATVSLMNHGPDTTVENLKALYKLMTYMKATADTCLTMRPIDINLDTHVVSYGDCSWANAQGLRSQEGIVVVLAPPECLEGRARCIMVDWKTCRTPRVVRSTLAGEAYAADDAIDRGAFVNNVLTELLTGQSVLRTGAKLAHVHATDCRSLFDSVITANPATEEKRVLLAIRAIQEAIDTKLFRWIPTTQMVADVLTKDSEQLRWAFLPWMRNPVCQLKDTGEVGAVK